ncbi:helix-turn-helix domain-containing protein [Exiguobacterium sp. S22-S28]|uniref:helix-turn-helix domain-containing protein n=1 Tax=Exiguobacterium sp. S22-S28 TaxID=3342768 RepID=UPI00372D0EAF
MDMTYGDEVNQMNIIGERIAKLEQMSGMTGKAISEKIGVSQQRYSAWKKGKNEPSSEYLEKIVDLHESTLDYVYGRTDNPKMSLQEYKTHEMAKLNILKFHGLTQEDIESISKKDFDMLMAMIKTMKEQKEKGASE